MTDCPHCRTFAQENNILHEEIVGLQAEVLKQMREKAALRGQLTKQRKQEDVSRHVMAVLRMWNALCTSHRGSIQPSGKNADNVRTALLHYVSGDMRQRRRMLYDAIRGAALRPYDAGYGERTANPAGHKRRTTTEHIFASETRIETLAGYYRMVQAKPLEKKQKVWQAVMDMEALWRSIAVDELVGMREEWRTPEPAAPAEPLHLFLDENMQEPAEVAEPEIRPKLFVIEGEADRAA